MPWLELLRLLNFAWHFFVLFSLKHILFIYFCSVFFHLCFSLLDRFNSLFYRFFITLIICCCFLFRTWTDWQQCLYVYTSIQTGCCHMVRMHSASRLPHADAGDKAKDDRLLWKSRRWQVDCKLQWDVVAFRANSANVDYRATEVTKNNGNTNSKILTIFQYISTDIQSSTGVT